MVIDDKELQEGLELRLQFGKDTGLIPVIVQDISTRQNLMLAYTDNTALMITQYTGLATFWNRSKKKYWIKGLTSGDTLSVKEIYVDCDQDTLLYMVTMNGTGVCHTKKEDGNYRPTCFYRQVKEDKNLTKMIE